MAERETTYKETAVTPRVVLDLGVGAYPWPPQPTMLQSSDGRELPRHFKDGKIYIGMDMPEDPGRYWVHFFAGQEPKTPPTDKEKKAVFNNLSLAQQYFRSLQPGENINFMAADGHKIPLKDCSVDEIYLSDVLGSQLLFDSTAKIMREVARVIKKTGQVVIKESVSPQWSNPENLPSDLESFGFEVREHIKYGGTRYDDLLNIYGQTYQVEEDDILADERYFLIAVPK